MMRKLSPTQMSVVARVLHRFAAHSTGTILDFYVLRALEQWISEKRDHPASRYGIRNTNFVG